MHVCVYVLIYLKEIHMTISTARVNTEIEIRMTGILEKNE